MISIDNAVELTIRTYLGLPKRVTGIGIGRKRYAEISESFPDMLDALEEYAGDRMTGIDLGEIEWFHRLRNQLYHNGNGLTVERAKVDVYAEIAKILWTNLLGGPEEEAPATPERPEDEGHQAFLLGQFMRAYARLDQAWTELLKQSAAGTEPKPSMRLRGMRILVREGIIDDQLARQLDELRHLRNQLVHGPSDTAEASLTTQVIVDLEIAAQTLLALAAREEARRGEPAGNDAHKGGAPYS